MRRCERNTALWRGGLFTFAFIGLCFLVAFQATRTVDWRVLTLTYSIASPPLDVAAALVSLLGKPHTTGAVALALAFSWWRQRGVRGLVPLLLFAGVAIEVVLKFTLPHPGPPLEFSRRVYLPWFLNFDFLPFSHFPTPYAFPSGHMLRTAFLVALFGEHMPRWRVAGWTLLCAMAFTRVYLNEHWVSDVGGGILLGLALAAIAVAINPRTPLLKDWP